MRSFGWWLAAVLLVLAWGRPALSDDAVTSHFSPILQAWLINDTSNSPWFNFRVRRAWLGWNGTLHSAVFWTASIDAAKYLDPSPTGTLSPKADLSILEDLAVGVKSGEHWSIALGQLRRPESLLGLSSYADLNLPEMSLFARRFGNRREPGLFLRGGNEVVSAAVSLTNGQGTNQDDVSRSKDLSARVEFAITPELRVGAFLAAANLSVRNGGFWGGSLSYRSQTLTLVAEGARSHQASDTGWATVVEGAWQVAPLIQPVLRGELFTPDDVNAPVASAGSIGVNFYPYAQALKIQVMAALTDHISNVRGTSQYATDRERFGLFLLSLQVTP